MFVNPMPYQTCHCDIETQRLDINQREVFIGLVVWAHICKEYYQITEKTGSLTCHGIPAWWNLLDSIILQKIKDAKRRFDWLLEQLLFFLPRACHIYYQYINIYYIYVEYSERLVYTNSFVLRIKLFCVSREKLADGNADMRLHIVSIRYIHPRRYLTIEAGIHMSNHSLCCFYWNRYLCRIRCIYSGYVFALEQAITSITGVKKGKGDAA